MRVLIISPYGDPAGVGITLKRAFDRYTDHEVRFVKRQANWLGYPADIMWREDRALVADLIAKADVVHMFDAVVPGTEGRPRLLHHHGTRFWVDGHGDPSIPAFGSTHDLSLQGLEWVPNPVPIAEMQRIREENRGAEPLIVQTPTKRHMKQTDIFLEAVAGLPHMLVEGAPWAESLRAKAKASVLFDSFAFGYGNTSLEAWGMGIPTVSGASSPVIETQIVEAIGYLPYLSATPETLREVLVEMLEDDTLRRFVADLGWQCVNDFHDDRKVVERWSRIYEQVAA